MPIIFRLVNLLEICYTHFMTRRLRRALISLFILFVLGGVVLKFLEPITWIDAFYLAAMTLSTVGFGDIVPTEEATRVFMIFYLFIGVGTALYTLGVFTEYRLHRRMAREQEIRTSKKITNKKK